MAGSIADIIVTGKSAGAGIAKLLNENQIASASRSLRKRATLSTSDEDSIANQAALQRRTELRARGRVRKRSGEMNRTEIAFSEELSRMKFAGEIAWWGWDCITLRLADRTHYRPDFAVLYADGLLRMIDTKGAKKKGDDYVPFCEEDAKMKLKIVAEQFPIIFAIAYRLPKKAGGGWRIADV